MLGERNEEVLDERSGEVLDHRHMKMVHALLLLDAEYNEDGACTVI